MWVCEKHRSDNKDALEKFKEEYQKNHKLVLGLFTAQIHINVNESVKMKPDSSILEANGGEPPKEKDSVEHRSISTSEATRKLKKWGICGGQTNSCRQGSVHDWADKGQNSSP